MCLISHINNFDSQKWCCLLDESPYASPFQTPEFYIFLNERTDLRADVFIIEKDDRYCALVVVAHFKEAGIKSFFSSRAIINGGPLLLKSEDEQVFRCLLEDVEAYYKRKAIYVEIRNYFNYQSCISTAESVAFRYIPWLNFQFKNLTPEQFKSGMKKTRLRQFNSALKNGVSWREAQSLQELSLFYDILADLYRNKVKKPLPSLEYFENLYQSDFATCLLVEKENQVIGGVMCLLYGQKVMYEYYICGKDREFKDSHPSIVATWAMVEYAHQKKIETIDLMGAGQAEKPSSVRDFKAKFGGEQVEYGRLLYVCKPILYALGKFYIRLFSN